MLDQRDDGSHEITLHNISCPGCPEFPNTSGVLRWTRHSGVTYSLTFPGIHSLAGSQYRATSHEHNPGVGRFSEANRTHPAWIARTDDGTDVRLHRAMENEESSQVSGTSGTGTSCTIEGMAVFAVVDIPTNRMLAFDNSTEEDYRLFFTGNAGRRFHKQEDVSFRSRDGAVHNTVRCSTTLSEAPGVALVSAHSLIKCRPSGWLAFDSAPTESDCEIPAFAERNFVSFINAEKVPFHWSDRRIPANKIRRTYFGWVKAKHKDRFEADHQPLPYLDGVEALRFGEEVLSHIPSLFQQFMQTSPLLDFGTALHPLWTALSDVLEDRLALASVSLERTASMWANCREAQLKEPLGGDRPVWEKKPVLKSLREALLVCLTGFVDSDGCSSLTSEEKQELQEVLTARINNLTQIPSSARLRQPFEDLQIPLSAKEKEAIRERNSALHGTQDGNSSDVKTLDEGAEIFDCLRMLLTKFVIKLCHYDGPYIDYASRPAAGNFEIKYLRDLS